VFSLFGGRTLGDFFTDNLLGAYKPYHDISSSSYVIGSTTQRVAVVQVRKDDGASVFSNTPVQPTPYQFYLTAYNINSWQDSQPLSDLNERFTRERGDG
jgi:hypothetical protein